MQPRGRRAVQPHTPQPRRTKAAGDSCIGPAVPPCSRPAPAPTPCNGRPASVPGAAARSGAARQSPHGAPGPRVHRPPPGPLARLPSAPPRGAKRKPEDGGSCDLPVSGCGVRAREEIFPFPFPTEFPQQKLDPAAAAECGAAPLPHPEPSAGTLRELRGTGRRVVGAPGVLLFKVSFDSPEHRKSSRKRRSGGRRRPSSPRSAASAPPGPRTERGRSGTDGAGGGEGRGADPRPSLSALLCRKQISGTERAAAPREVRFVLAQRPPSVTRR